MRYLVTGASGFLGGHLVDRLLEAGHTVRAHVLEPDAAAELEARGVEVRRGDLVQDGELAPWLEGVDVVVHCAGIAAQRAALLLETARLMDEAQLFIPVTAPVRWALVSGRAPGFAENPFARHTLVGLADTRISGDTP